MSLPEIPKSSYLPATSSGKKPTPKKTAAAYSQSGSFGKALLPNYRNVRNYVPANSTKVGYRAATGKELATRFNSGQVTSNRSVGLSGAMGVSASTQTVNYGGQDWATFAMQALPTAMQLLNTYGVNSKSNNNKNTNTENYNQQAAVPKSQGANLSERVSSSVSDMKNASNSSELRSAISTAEQDLNKMKTESEGLKTNATKAQAKQKELSTSVDSLQTSVKKQEGVVNQKKDAVTSCKTKLSGLKPDYSEKVSAYQTAQSNTAAAEAELKAANAMPAITPEQQAAKSKAVAAAQAKVVEAKAQESSAKLAKEQAYNALQDGEGKVKQAEEALAKSQEELKNAEAELGNQKKALDKAKADLDEVNKALEDYQQHTQDMADLETSIADNKKVLAKMEKEETSEYKNLQKKVKKDDARNDKLLKTVSDSPDSKKSGEAAGKIAQNNRENADRNERLAYLEMPVAETAVANAKPEFVDEDGNEFKQVAVGADIYYAINGQLMTRDEYQKRLNEAK